MNLYIWITIKTKHPAGPSSLHVIPPPTTSCSILWQPAKCGMLALIPVTHDHHMNKEILVSIIAGIMTCANPVFLLLKLVACSSSRLDFAPTAAAAGVPFAKGE